MEIWKRELNAVLVVQPDLEHDMGANILYLSFYSSGLQRLYNFHLNAPLIHTTYLDETTMAEWLDALNTTMAGPSFIDRVRNAAADDDVPIRDDFGPILAQDIAEETSLQQLIRHWMNERHAPDILPAQEHLLGRLLDHIRKQVSLRILFFKRVGVTSVEAGKVC